MFLLLKQELHWANLGYTTLDSYRARIKRASDKHCMGGYRSRVYWHKGAGRTRSQLAVVGKYYRGFKRLC